MKFLPRVRRCLVPGFICFHLTALILVCFPGSSAVRSRLAIPFRPYFELFNLWQNWGMFAPEPSNLNAFLRAVVKFSDGDIRTYDLPRMSELGLMDRHVMERYRKWAIDNVRADSNSAYWPAAARFVARKLKQQEGKTPTEVELWRYWTQVEAPELHYRPLKYRLQDFQLQRAKFFTIGIHPEDL